MTSAMVFTFVGADKPGLVEKLAQTVGQHGGNWLESRMSELAGQFAGIVQVEVSLQRSRGRSGRCPASAPEHCGKRSSGHRARSRQCAGGAAHQCERNGHHRYQRTHEWGPVV